MPGVSRRHAAVLEELIEWWEDISRDQVGSQVVLIPIPTGWGRTTLLARFTGLIEADEQVSLTVSVRGGSLPEGLGLQAAAIRERFTEAGLRAGWPRCWGWTGPIGLPGSAWGSAACSPRG